MLLAEGVTPVVGEVAVAADRAELEYRFVPGQAPAGAGDVHPVLYQVPAGALDDPGRDRPAVREGGGVVEVGSLVEQVVGGPVSSGALLAVESAAGRFAGGRGGRESSLC